MNENHFIKLAAIDVSKHVEKKQNLSYLSWPFAIDQLMRHDPNANWEFHPPEMYGESMMVSCTVTAFGKPVKMHLPVMDHRNQAVKNPDAFVVNKNMMRCLVKAIACHGLGLHIYAGEDLPISDDGNAAQRKQPDIAAILKGITSSISLDILRSNYEAAMQMLDASHHPAIKKAANARKAELTTKAAEHAERIAQQSNDESKYQ